jgi:hypothetical protein
MPQNLFQAVEQRKNALGVEFDVGIAAPGAPGIYTEPGNS